MRVRSRREARRARGEAGAGEAGAGEWGMRRVEATRTAKLASLVEEATAVMEAAYGRSVPPPPSSSAAPSRAQGADQAGEGADQAGAGADQAGGGADPAADPEGCPAATEPRLLAALRAQWGGWESGWESSRLAGAAPPASVPGATPGEAGGAGATSCASLAAVSRGARPAESRRGARLSWSDAFGTGSAPLQAAGAAPASASPASGARSDGIPSIRPATSAIAQFVPLEAASRSKKPAKRRKSSGF